MTILPAITRWREDVLVVVHSSVERRHFYDCKHIKQCILRRMSCSRIPQADARMDAKELEETGEAQFRTLFYSILLGNSIDLYQIWVNTSRLPVYENGVVTLSGV